MTFFLSPSVDSVVENAKLIKCPRSSWLHILDRYRKPEIIRAAPIQIMQANQHQHKSCQVDTPRIVLFSVRTGQGLVIKEQPGGELERLEAKALSLTRQVQILSAAAAAARLSRDPLPGACLVTRMGVEESRGREYRSRRPATMSRGGESGQRRASVQVNLDWWVMRYECGLQNIPRRKKLGI